jgi:hypothetical protein
MLRGRGRAGPARKPLIRKSVRGGVVVALWGASASTGFPDLGEDTESRNDTRATAVWWNSARHARRAVPLTESECQNRSLSYSAQSLLLVS